MTRINIYLEYETRIKDLNYETQTNKLKSKLSYLISDHNMNLPWGRSPTICLSAANWKLNYLVIKNNAGLLFLIPYLNTKWKVGINLKKCYQKYKPINILPRTFKGNKRVKNASRKKKSLFYKLSIENMFSFLNTIRSARLLLRILRLGRVPVCRVWSGTHGCKWLTTPKWYFPYV